MQLDRGTGLTGGAITAESVLQTFASVAIHRRGSIIRANNWGTRMIRLTSIIITLLLALEAMAQNNPTDADIRQSYHEHAALAQLHRWYQYYENELVPLDNQLNLLSETITVVAPSGTVDSRDAYALAVQQIPKEWKNSHELQSASIGLNEDDSLSLMATITFNNIGMMPEGAVRTSLISYKATLQQSDSALPVFSQIEIEPGAQLESDGFRDNYPENRLLSLMHYWMALVEHPDRASEPFKEILAPEIAIDFGNGKPITSFEQLQSWMKGPASSVEASRHQNEDFVYKEIGSDRYEMQFVSNWRGIRPDGVTLSAKTRHSWTVADNPLERFARVEAITVEVLEPFAVVTD